MKGPEDKDCVLRDDYSINLPIRKCSDFVNKKTMLQHIGEECLGIIVDRAPKYVLQN